MIEVRETRLPGVGKKFTMRTHLGEDVCAVVHIDGRRELYYRPDPDEDAEAVIVLSDDEAHELGSILGGVVYRPELLDKLEVALKDLAIDWIDIPPDSPLVGLTVATCRIRTTTGGTIVAIIRKENSVAMPHPDEVIQANDTLVVITTPETFEALQRLVAEGPSPDVSLSPAGLPRGMRDPDRRSLGQVLRGKGTPSLRGLLMRAVVGVGLVLGVLTAVAIFAVFWSTTSYRDDQQVAVDRARASEVILADLLNAETGVSGYTLTGGSSYLVPYVRAEGTYPRSIGRLRDLVEGNEDLEAAVGSIDRAAREWFREARTLVNLRRDGRVSEAVARIGEGIDKARLDALRAEHADLRELVEAERQLALERADQGRWLAVLAVVGGALLAVLTVVAATRALWRRVGAPLGALSQGVRRVGAGDLEQSVPRPEHGAREVVQLVDAFNVMQGRVVDQRKEAEASARRSEAARAERRLWQTVEQGLLPESLPAVPGLRLAARYQPSSPGLAVGGDFYDARALPDGRLAVMVGDVAGHGAESAARAARMRFGWGALVEVDPDPQRVLEIMNTHIAEPHERDQGVYATMRHCIIAPDGSAEFALAGHPCPLLVTGTDAGLVEVDARGPILGLLDEVEWPVTRVQVPPGAAFVIYTDGLVEARRGDEIFGWRRAAQVLAASRGTSLEQRIANLTDAAQRYDEADLRDDVAVLAVQPVGPPGA